MYMQRRRLPRDAGEYFRHLSGESPIKKMRPLTVSTPGKRPLDRRASRQFRTRVFMNSFLTGSLFRKTSPYRSITAGPGGSTFMGTLFRYHSPRIWIKRTVRRKGELMRRGSLSRVTSQPIIEGIVQGVRPIDTIFVWDSAHP